MQQQIEETQTSTKKVSLWQKVKQHRLAIILICISIVIIAVIVSGYIFDLNGIGVGPFTQTTTAAQNGNITITKATQPGVTVWNWIQVFINPYGPYSREFLAKSCAKPARKELYTG